MKKKKEKDTRSNVTRRDFIKTTVAGSAAAAGLAMQPVQAAGVDALDTAIPKWDRVVDVVVVGAGAAGLPAAIRARDRGASVMIVEAHVDIGGHAMISGGEVALGGGTSLQKQFE